MNLSNTPTNVQVQAAKTSQHSAPAPAPEQILVWWWPAGRPGQVCHIQPAEQRGRSVAAARVNRDPIHHCTVNCTVYITGSPACPPDLLQGVTLGCCYGTPLFQIFTTFLQDIGMLNIFF